MRWASFCSLCLEALCCLIKGPTTDDWCYPIHVNPSCPAQTLMRERRAAAWRHLNVVERDVLIVVTALCKVGAQPDERSRSAAGLAVLHVCTRA